VLISTPDTSNGEALRARAKRGLAIYFACILLGSGICEGLILRTGEPIEKHMVLAVVNMWVPALASLVARLALQEGVSDVSFALPRRHGLRMLCLGWLYPVGVGFLAYGIAWALHLEVFAAPQMARVGLEHANPLLKLAASIGLTLTIGTAFSSLSAAGEEFGWRGFMLTRLIDAGFKRPLLISGLIWSGWHLPLILSGQYAAGPNPLMSAVLFVVSTTAGAYVAARVRLESGSIWPAVVYHASWNAIIQGVFDRFTAGGNASHTTTTWTGESGFLVVAVDVLFAALLMLRPWSARRSPTGDANRMATFSLRNA
jgi:uncharacterized protein